MEPISVLPHRELPYVETAGRFGDWREPLLFDLQGRDALAAAAASLRIDAGVALTLLVERALLLTDVDALGHDVDDARLVLGLEAEEQTVVLGPGLPNAGYARGLNGSSSPGDVDGVFSLPARILPRASEPLVASTLAETPLRRALAEAVAWERSALATDRLMAEWALLVLLAAMR
jgi:hypothetical protein